MLSIRRPAQDYKKLSVRSRTNVRVRTSVNDNCNAGDVFGPRTAIKNNVKAPNESAIGKKAL